MKRNILVIPIFALSVSVVGCTIGPDYITPTTEMPLAYVDSDGLEATDETKTTPWWKEFHDQTLDFLIERAIHNNKDLDIAISRVNQSRALRREAMFMLLPEGAARVEYNKQKSPGFRFGNDNTQPIEFESYTVGFDALWEIDILGRSRRNLEARTAEHDAAVADLEDAVRILVAEVARAYFELRGSQTQLGVAEKNVETQTEVLKMVRVRSEMGVGTELDSVRAAALLSTTKATVPPLQSSVKRSMNEIAVLLGVQPHEVRETLEPRGIVPIYTGELRIGNPSELLRNRPDIRAAERLLAASVADIGVATGNLFPKASISGSIYFEALSPDDIGKSGTDGYAIGPRIEWAALDLGKVFAQIDAADAASRTALKNYERAVLVALEETSSALATLRSARDRVQELRQSVALNQRALDLSVAGYKEGAIDFLTVLEAQKSLLVSEAQVTNGETDLSTAVVTIYKALGLGWEEFQIVEQKEATS